MVDGLNGIVIKVGTIRKRFLFYLGECGWKNDGLEIPTILKRMPLNGCDTFGYFNSGEFGTTPKRIFPNGGDGGIERDFFHTFTVMTKNIIYTRSLIMKGEWLFFCHGGRWSVRVEMSCESE